MAFYGYCGPTAILYILKTTAKSLREKVVSKGNGGIRGSEGVKGNLLKRETIKKLAKKNKIYALLLHIPSLNALGDKLNTSAKLGTSPEDMVRFLKRTGFKVRVKEEAEWSDLQKAYKAGKMTLIDWWTDIGDPGQDLGHYSVVLRVSRKTLTIYDPDINKKRRLGKEKFLERWHDVRADGRKMLSWMATIRN